MLVSVRLAARAACTNLRRTPACRLTCLPSSSIGRTSTLAVGYHGSSPIAPVGISWSRSMSSSPTKKARRAAEKQHEAAVEATQRKLTIALVGRPNAGKSRLFNRLVGKRLALVNATAGTTRDWKEEEGQLGALNLIVMDTGGLEDAQAPDSIAAKMKDHTSRAIQHADVVLYMFDARQGITDDDHKFVRWLKRIRPADGIHLVANKAEHWHSQTHDEDEEFIQDSVESAADAPVKKFVEPAVVMHDSLSLGLGDPIAISAEHGTGLGDLYNVLHEHHEALAHAEDAVLESELEPEGEPEAPAVETGTAPIKLAIVGRPNVGKSSLVNYLLGEERVLAGPVPGLTRDTTTVTLDHKGATFELVDTAGMRRWGSWDLTTPLEGEAVGAAKRALNLANVVVLVVDASGGAGTGLPTDGVATKGVRTSRRDAGDGTGLTRQDMSIAEQILAEGRALIVVANKIDTVDNAARAIALIEAQLENMHLGQGTPVMPLSSLKQHGKDGLLNAVKRVYDKWNMKIGTSKLNTWLQLISRHHPAPAVTQTLTSRTQKDGTYATRKVPLRIKYITQVTNRPPTFKLFANRANFPETYLRFLNNSLRKEFDMWGVPVRLTVQTSVNPYSTKSSGSSAPKKRNYRPHYPPSASSTASAEVSPAIAAKPTPKPARAAPINQPGVAVKRLRSKGRDE